MTQFNNKLAVVTGGCSGLGQGISEKLATLGAQVIVADLKTAEQGAQFVATEKQQGYDLHFYHLDVSVAEQVKQFGEWIETNFGLVDYWINCAGISIITPFLQHTEAIWDKTLDINLKGQFLCCQIAVQQMLQKHQGVIINLSSESGKKGTNNYAAYCASKFGVIGLTQSLAAEFGPQNIRVNSIAPGVVYTPMWEKQKQAYAEKKNIQADEVMDYFANKIPLRRIGTLADIANIVTFLLSDDASYITGQTINLNGGDLMF
ncbi:Diacetyl reductase ((R)-acetoin forming) [Bombilactobacillus mellifer]|uniref:Diacetyl reductase ((R)-acetoin forming) n=1 Tax=Bombilactobacillus mellifer TaxID=1218492 RepID=A0A0F4LS69_9LACO|nr:SDR family oxidoreductase [Bombilactobacillus mellifer]KJY60426.1 Diacetyl reductase ((R)-acetoin forming) [Bombilactobacillus mellifer]MCT6844430.1 SDR family oxidoreductase [Bombilactobacillus mellifer]